MESAAECCAGKEERSIHPVVGGSWGRGGMGKDYEEDVVWERSEGVF